MNVFQRALRCMARKRVKSLLLFLAVFIISLFLLASMAAKSAGIEARDSTRQAVGAGFLLENNPENRATRLAEASSHIGEQEGSWGGVHQQKTEGGWQTWTDHSFESLRLEDIETIARTEGLEDYTVTTVPTAVMPDGFQRIEDPAVDQTGDFPGVTLIGNRNMALDSHVLDGSVTIADGRMIGPEEENVCVISEELAEKNDLQVGDSLSFHSVKAEEPVQTAEIVGIYCAGANMRPYMSGETYRSENVIFTDLHFPEKVEQDDPLYEKAYFKVADVNEYDSVRERMREAAVDWERYDLIDNNGTLETMASNFNGMDQIGSLMLYLSAGAGLIILFLIFLFWIRNRTGEIGILLSLGISRGKILLQILTEGLLVGALAVSLSWLAAPAVSEAAAGYLAGQQEQQAELEREMDAGKVATDYQEPELTVTGVRTEVTAPMMAAGGLGVGALILISTSAAGILILRRNPRDILAAE